ncbi:MAG: hypothetical protein R3D25_14435 [Geminicoccaceae bacterium]
MREQTTASSYYPDHVIFLGPAAATPERFAARASSSSSCRAKAPICPRTPSPPPTSWRSASPSSSPACPGDARLINHRRRGGHLLGWDAEKYRQSLIRPA